MRFAEPVAHVYNPLEYAIRPHRLYIRRFADGPRRVVFLGMNPGPYGMAQTGIPFGEITHVRDWLGLTEEPTEEQLSAQVRPDERQAGTLMLALTVTPPPDVLPAGIPVVMGYTLKGP